MSATRHLTDDELKRAAGEHARLTAVNVRAYVPPETLELARLASAAAVEVIKLRAANAGRLKARAIAALLALRAGGLNTKQLQVRIGDPLLDEVNCLVRSMRELQLVRNFGTVWYVDSAGVDRLKQEGLGIERRATYQGAIGAVELE